VADELCEQFVEACRTHGSHPDAGANIVGLSGGHDSRAVLAGMVKAGVSCQAFTGVAHGRQLKHEVSSAKAVAQALRVMQWTYETPLADMAMNRELVRIKDGLTTVANAFNIADLRLLRDRFGFSATYVTGDGGDKALPDLRLPHRSRSLPALAREIGRSYGSHGLPAETAARLTGVPIDDLYDDLERLLASYPEQDLEQKGVHFALYERGRRFVFEGEDRKRFFFAWQTSPFLSHPFLSACMRVPDRAKTDRRLYRRFLAMLSPETAAIPLTKVGVGAADPTYLARTWLRRRYDTLPWSVRDRIKRRLKKAARPVETAPEVAATIQTALAKRDGLGAIVDQDLLRKLGPRGARHILTLALTVEALPVSSST
jgi:asparagine synthase (glutamine-hydrolysing)